MIYCTQYHNILLDVLLWFFFFEIVL
jgi:hypothetical protein